MLQLTWYRVTVRYILNSDVKIAIIMPTCESAYYFC